MEDAAQQAERLIAFLRKLNRSRDLDSLAQAVLHHAVSMTPGAQRGSFMLLNQETGCYEFRAAVGWPLDQLQRVVVPTSQVLQRIAHGDQPAIIRDPYHQDREHGLHKLAETFNELFGPVRSILTFPIAYEGQVVAYFNLDNLEDPDAFSQEDLQRLEAVQEEIAVAVHAILGRDRLAKLERFFRGLFEQLADAVYIVEFDGTILQVNRAACEQSGYSREELIGMNIMRELAHEQPVMSHQDAIRRLRTGELARFQEVKRRKDGTLYVTDCAVTVFEHRDRPVTLSINRDITEQTNVERKFERRNRELEALLHASQALTSTLDLGEVIARIQERVASLIPCDGFFVALLDRSGTRLRLELMVEQGVSLGKHTVDADPRISLTGWVVHHGEPLLIGDTEREQLPAAFQQVGRPTRSWLGVPLVTEGRPVGVMSVQSFAPHAFSQEDLRLLTAFGGLVASAIHNAKLHADVSALQEKLLAVERAAREMKLAEGKKELYEQLLEATKGIFGYEVCGVMEVEEQTLRVVLACGGGPKFGEFLPLGGPGITVAAWHAGQSLYVPDVAGDPRYIEGAVETRSELAIPFWVGTRQAGVFDVQSPEASGIPPEDRNLLEVLVSHMAVALTGLERLQAVRTISEKLQLLHHAVAEMQHSRDPRELCEIAVRTASDVLGMSTCNVGLAEGEWMVPVASSGGAANLGRPMRRGEGLVGRVWETGRTLWGNVRDFPYAKPLQGGPLSVITVPVGHEGVFQAISPSEDAFSPADVSLAEILVGHVHSGLERLRLEAELREQATRDPLTGLHNRRHMAEVLQRELQRARRYGHPISVIMADIDHFKLVNDRFGHLKGDQVLREIAGLLRESVRSCDYIFRYGGEEFVILLPETATRAGEVIERLHEGVRRWAASADLGDLQFGLTMGSAVWDPSAEPHATPEDLLRRADHVLYSFKRRREH